MTRDWRNEPMSDLNAMLKCLAYYAPKSHYGWKFRAVVRAYSQKIFTL